MDLESLTDNEKRKCINEFKTRCYWFYRTYRINRTLFENNTDSFGSLESPKVLNNALVDYPLLQFHIITDPAKFGKKDKNLSVFFFLEWSWEPEVKLKLETLAQKLKEFVDFKRKDNPRHKLLAHWDVATILSSPGALGGFSVGKEVEFFNNLNDFIETMGIAVGFQDEWTMLSDTRADENVLVDIIKAGGNSMRKNGESGKGELLTPPPHTT
jgi:hypothetical protein